MSKGSKQRPRRICNPAQPGRGFAIPAKEQAASQSGGLLLIGCTILSLILANTPAAHFYLSFWHLSIFTHPLEFWINDALMAIFFLLVGLEIRKELIAGELANRRKATLPVLAALGGMLVPALIHFGLNHGTPAQKGFGIPMATDIAFSLAVLSLLGKRIPASLKIFLTALAIIDDLGAILVIALCYTQTFSLLYLAFAGLIFGGLLLMNRLGARRLWLYLIPGGLLWYCMYRSGIHATISGVLLAFTIPFKSREKEAPAARLEHTLAKPVALLILPLFALANTCISIPHNWVAGLTTNNSTGIILGLWVGKPAGIFLFSMAGIAAGVCTLPSGTSKIQLFACACLAGIGFTMSIFITLLAFQDPGVIATAKIAVMVGSFLSALAGYFLLKLTLREKQT